MRWQVFDYGSFDRAYITEVELRPGCVSPMAVAVVYPPTFTFEEPTDTDRAQMLATAQEIVDAHNAKEMSDGRS